MITNKVDSVIAAKVDSVFITLHCYYFLYIKVGYGFDIELSRYVHPA